MIPSMKPIASLAGLLLASSLFAASSVTTTTTTTTVVVPPTKVVVVKPPVVVVPKVTTKKPEVERKEVGKCDDKNVTWVKVVPVTTTKTGTCNKK
jgi:hypothetical protein